MFKSFFDFLNNTYYKHSKHFMKLVNNATFIKCFQFVKFHLFQKQHNVNFYRQNAERINGILNILADEKSKHTYSAIIKFRQTRSKKDFPSLYCSEMRYSIEEISFTNDEVFIDCGAYNGDTIDSFLENCSEYKKIIAFEPFNENFEELKRKYGNNPKITLINAGTYSKDGVVHFVGGAGSGKIFKGKDSEKFVTIPVKAIDNLNVDKVTFIKMDIEGAEKTIIKDKPKLAICIYHSNDDMIDIIEYIHNLVPEYKLYVRQHSTYPFYFDTVLYAFI